MAGYIQVNDDGSTEAHETSGGTVRKYVATMALNDVAMLAIDYCGLKGRLIPGRGKSKFSIVAPNLDADTEVEVVVWRSNHKQRVMKKSKSVIGEPSKE